MRYQFEPCIGHFLNFEDARAAVRAFGGTHLKVCYPVMVEYKAVGRQRYWRGTNQPKTLAFTYTGGNPTLAIVKIEEAYGFSKAHVVERMSLR